MRTHQQQIFLCFHKGIAIFRDNNNKAEKMFGRFFGSIRSLLGRLVGSGGSPARTVPVLEAKIRSGSVDNAGNKSKKLDKI